MSTTLVLALLGALLAVMVIFFRKGDAEGGGISQNRVGDRLRDFQAKKKKYAVMTPALLAETEDDQLLEAVLCNLWAKMKPDLADAFTVMQGVSQGRQYIFTLYAVTGAINQYGIQKLKESSDAKMIPQCLEALEAVDLPDCARILREAADAQDGEPYSAPYREHFQADGLAKMTAWIRAHPAHFCDEG